MKLNLIALTMAAASSMVHAAPERYVLDPGHTYPIFEIQHMGFSTQRGWFEKTQGTISIDRTSGTGELNVEIDAASVYSSHLIRDKALRSEQFFDVERFPKITYKSNRFVVNPGGDLQSIEGELTMRGVIKPVTLKVANFRCGLHPVNKQPMCGGEANTELNKTDFGTFRRSRAGADDPVTNSIRRLSPTLIPHYPSVAAFLQLINKAFRP